MDTGSEGPGRSSARGAIIATPASGHGKTTLTAALARHHRNAGERVRVFKVGPDFLDPMIQARASGAEVHNLDPWMMGEDYCRALLAEAAAEVDVVLVEGVMGLFDGRSSTADAARRFGLPVLLGVDAGGMAETLAAVVHGLTTYDPELPFAGVVANNVGSPGHAAFLSEAMADLAVPFLGGIPRDERMALPERYLGLVQGAEIADLDARLDAAAEAVAEAGVTPDLPAFEPLPGEFPDVAPRLAGRRIAVARDSAFAFCYPANRRLLSEMGAELVNFSPVAGDGLPAGADAVYLPGGYPELQAPELAANTGLWRELTDFVGGGGPVLAECGGMLPLFESLKDAEGQSHAMAGLLDGRVAMEHRLQGLGMQAVDLGGGELRGHTFHYSRLETVREPDVRAVRQRGSRPGEGVYRRGGLTATYLHLHFASNPDAVAGLFGG